MKVEIISEAHIALRAETDEEKVLLKKFAREGVKVSHTGSTLGICSPALAGLVPLYLSREEQALLAYAVGNVVSIDSPVALRAKELICHLVPSVYQPDIVQGLPPQAVRLKKVDVKGVRIVCHTCDGAGKIKERKWGSLEDEEVLVVCPECNGEGCVMAEAVEEAST